MSIFRAFALPAVTAALLIACASSDKNTAVVPNTATGVTSAQQSADERVVDQLADGRCNHEQKCNNVGPGQHYVSMESCRQQMRGSTTDELNAYNCPRGISEPALKHCVDAINSAQCGNFFDQLATSNDCRSQDMCIQ